MYCNKCGTKLPEDAIFCSNCGSAVHTNDGQVYDRVPDQNNYYNQNAYVQEDKQSWILNFVGFLSPIIGWIMYFFMKKTTPNKAKGCLIWATVSFVLSLVYNTLFYLML